MHFGVINKHCKCQIPQYTTHLNYFQLMIMNITSLFCKLFGPISSVHSYMSIYKNHNNPSDKRASSLIAKTQLIGIARNGHQLVSGTKVMSCIWIQPVLKFNRLRSHAHETTQHSNKLENSYRSDPSCFLLTKYSKIYYWF